SRTLLLDLPHRLEELDGVIGVLLHAGADGQDVGIENDVLGREADLFCQQLEDPLANSDLTLGIDGLALLVKGHHNDGGPVATDEPGLIEELLLSLLEADRVDDALALDALESRLDDLPFRGIDHDWQPKNLGFRPEHAEEARHGCNAVDHP